MNQETLKIRLIYGMLILIFGVVSLLLPKVYKPNTQDFASYWQAGYMLRNGQNVYDSASWIAVREALRTARYTEPTFIYPLPFVVLVSPISLLPIYSAYVLWVFITQITILISTSVLLSFTPRRSANLVLMAFAGVYLFRATFITIFSGQVLFLMLLVTVFSIYLLQKHNQFWAGALLALLTFKPSFGLAVLLLVGIWFLFTKRWASIAGMITGGLTLLLIGMLANPRWVLDYLSVSGTSFDKYYGRQATIWGMTGYLFTQDWSIWVSVSLVSIALLASAYFLWTHRSSDKPLFIFAVILPVSLLTAPYSWAHDHILLIVPILYLFMKIVNLWGSRMGGIFLASVVFLATGLVSVAYAISLDVWSILVPLGILLLVLFLEPQLHNENGPAPALEH